MRSVTPQEELSAEACPESLLSTLKALEVRKHVSNHCVLIWVQGKGRGEEGHKICWSVLVSRQLLAKHWKVAEITLNAIEWEILVGICVKI